MERKIRYQGESIEFRLDFEKGDLDNYTRFVIWTYTNPDGHITKMDDKDHKEYDINVTVSRGDEPYIEGVIPSAETAQYEIGLLHIDLMGQNANGELVMIHKLKIPCKILDDEIKSDIK